uniref:Uncharacterized protein n=1 Tax=viral metagenome TaxID=1070528 RepID=A0A6C0C7D0_9ZZZZ
MLIRQINLIHPFDASDNIYFLIVGVQQKNESGQFIFPKQVLIDKNIFSVNNIGGKLSFRVYPPWSKPISKTSITIVIMADLILC